jgi:hypothetical protein
MGGKGKLRNCECGERIYTADWHQHCLSKHKNKKKIEVKF